MSIVTKTGDRGTTGLMYNRRVSKCHPRVEAYGCVDELNSALGLARAAVAAPELRERILQTQRDLIMVMGELATEVSDLPRYLTDGYQAVTPAMTGKLDLMAQDYESALARFSGWAIPGDTAASAALDVARTTCRRAERRVCALEESDQLHNPEIIVFLNRLADVLWLMGRWVDSQTSSKPTTPPAAGI
ncbi:MAG: cob(I)yrinic acid a,c-diamide adenosyltransferase [Limisphaerales bacterium]